MPASAPQPAARRSAPWQFSLRGLLGLMFVSGVLVAVWKVAPQGVVLATGVLAAVISSRRVAGDLLKRRSVCAGPCAATAIAWCGLYGVSIGPAVGLLDWLPLSRQSVEWFYAPLVWLHDHSALAGPLEWQG